MEFLYKVSQESLGEGLFVKIKNMPYILQGIILNNAWPYLYETYRPSPKPAARFRLSSSIDQLKKWDKEGLLDALMKFYSENPEIFDEKDILMIKRIKIWNGKILFPVLRPSKNDCNSFCEEKCHTYCDNHIEYSLL